MASSIFNVNGKIHDVFFLAILALLLPGSTSAQDAAKAANQPSTPQPLTVDVQPMGNFQRGQPAAFILTLSTPRGTIKPDVLVMDTLPPGVTPVKAYGDDWQCNEENVACYHSGNFVGSDDPITLQVDISTTAAAVSGKITIKVMVAAGDGNSIVKEQEVLVSKQPPLAPASQAKECDRCRKPPKKSDDPNCRFTTKRARTDGYNVLEYDAKTGQTSWFAEQKKYSRTWTTDMGPLLPIVSTDHSRIMVEVCGLKFDTALNVSQSATNVPEQVADIRGATPTPAPQAPGASVDQLQSAGASIASALAATLPSTSTPAGIVQNQLVTLGEMKSSSGGLAYTPVSVVATPADFKNAIVSYQAEARSTLDALRAVCLDKTAACGQVPASPLVLDADIYNGTVMNMELRALALYDKINRLYAAPNHESDQGTFDDALAAAGRFAVDLSALDSKISAATFNKRIATLATTYDSLYGDLFTLRQLHDAYDDAYTAAHPRASTTAPATAHAAAPASAPAPADCSAILAAITTPQAPSDRKKGSNQKPTKTLGSAQPSANLQDVSDIEGEYCYLHSFLMQLAVLNVCVDQHGLVAPPAEPWPSKASGTPPNSKPPEPKAICNADAAKYVVTPDQLYHELNALRSELQQIDQTTSNTFAILNRWYDESHVVQTDALSPSTSNADLRIGVNATETYVPVVLSVASAGTADAPPASSSAAASSGHFESSTIVRVERVVHFNLVGGVMIIHVPNKNYTYNEFSYTPPSTNPPPTITPCSGLASIATPTSATNYFCPVATSTTRFQVAGMAGVNWIPWGRNYYPLGAEPKGEDLHHFFNKFGILFASSITSLGTGFGGANYEATNGIDLFAGVASAHSQTLPAGTAPLTETSPAPSTVPTVSTLHFGFSFGVGFDLGVFRTIFTSTSAPAIP